MGAFTSEMMTSMQNKTKVDFRRVIIPGIFSGFLLCAIQGYMNFIFSVYAFICFVSGMWGLYLLQVMTNIKFIDTMIKGLLKMSSAALSKAAESGLDEVKKEMQSEETTGEPNGKK